mgnify:CR=1 FL=1
MGFSACTADPSGLGQGDNGAPIGGTAATGGTTGQPLDCSKPAAPRAPLRRLIRFEYNNTVRDLLGIPTRPADALPGEELGNGFGNDADALGVSRLLVDGYRTVAHDLSLAATSDSVALTTLMGCDVTLDESACVQTFVAGFGARAFRRPLEAAEVAALSAMFAKGKELSGSLGGGARAVLELILQSPQFLYRIELGASADAAGLLGRPTSYEMATRLSYLLWGSAPDQALLDAASQDKLHDKQEILAQATRLLADPRAREVVRFFHGQLLGTSGLDGLVRNTEYYPTFTPGMGSLYRRETEHFIDHVIWEDKGDLATLLSAPYTFLNQSLASVYGVSGVSGEAFQKVMLNPAERGGLLTQPGILSLTTPGSRTDPVIRGKWVLTRLLCGKIGDPPPDVPQLAEPEPGLSVRDRLASHREVEPCKTCHRYMDPIGFGFEHYDGMGRWRETDNALPVDASGELIGSDVDGSFTGAVELGRKLSQSAQVQRCFVGNWLTYAYGRAETPDDACTRAALESAFEKSGGRVHDLLLALTQSDAFLYRPVTAH